MDISVIYSRLCDLGAFEHGVLTYTPQGSDVDLR